MESSRQVLHRIIRSTALREAGSSSELVLPRKALMLMESGQRSFREGNTAGVLTHGVRSACFILAWFCLARRTHLIARSRKEEDEDAKSKRCCYPRARCTIYLKRTGLILFCYAYLGSTSGCRKEEGDDARAAGGAGRLDRAREQGGHGVDEACQDAKGRRRR